jgi:hypothetical protein
VDLPSAETERRKGPIEWVRALFGAQIDLRSGREELTVGALWLVEGLVEAFAAMGVDDVISFIVDEEVVYLDAEDVPGDLPMILRAAERSGVLDRKFHEMHLVLAHRSEALHTIIDCQVKNGVLLGEAEMTIALSGRIRELQIRRGETARRYAERVQAFAAGGETFEPTRRELDALTERIANELTSVLRGAKVTREAAAVQLVRPDARQVGRFGRLGFGGEVRTPTYRAIPTARRDGAYDDPFYYYHHDPYYDFTSYLLVDSMIHHGAWRSPHVRVVDPAGAALFAGDDPPRGEDGWRGYGAVSFGEGGELEVSSGVMAEAEAAELEGDGEVEPWEAASPAPAGDAAGERPAKTPTETSD